MSNNPPPTSTVVWVKRAHALAVLANVVSGTTILALTLTQDAQCSPVYFAFPVQNPSLTKTYFERDLVGMYCHRYAFAIVLFVSAGVHTFGYMTGPNQQLCRNPVMWVEYAFTTTLMLTSTAVIAGILDFNTLFNLSACNLAVQFSSSVAEALADPNRKNPDSVGRKGRISLLKSDFWRAPYALSVFLQVIPWLSIFVAFFGGVVRSPNLLPPPASYVLVLGGFVLYMGLRVLFYLQLTKVFLKKGAVVSTTTNTDGSVNYPDSDNLYNFQWGSFFLILGGIATNMWLSWSAFATSVKTVNYA